MTALTPARLVEPYAARLRRWLVLHPDGAATGIVATSTCTTCGVPMQRVLNTRRDDTSWRAVDGTIRGGTPPNGFADPWDWVEWAAANDVAAYSRAVAHHDITRSWPWQHTHQPAPTETSVSEQDALDDSFRSTYLIDPDHLVPTDHVLDVKES